MKDFLKNEIKVGDKVIYVKHCKMSTDIIPTIVLGFTPEMVRIAYKHFWRDTPSVVSPTSLIVVNQQLLETERKEWNITHD
jgi:hypothetical protein